MYLFCSSFDNNEYFEALRKVANSFLKILLKDLVDKRMVAAAVK
jgi:hypothetical protein